MTFNLSDQRKQILAVLQHQGDLSLKDLGAKLGMQIPNLQYHIKVLKEHGILTGPVPFINPYPLGYTDYEILISLRRAGAGEREALIKKLINTPAVPWVAELVGEYQIACTVSVQTIEEVTAFLATLSKGSPDLVHSVTVTGIVSFRTFGRKYIWPKYGAGPILTRGREGKLVSIDPLSHQILRILSKHAPLSQREVARRLGKPVNLVVRRVQKLKENGIIGGFSYRVNLNSFQVQRHRILIKSRGHSSALTKRLFEFSKKHLLVNHLVECLGAWDFALEIEVFGLEELQQFLDELQGEFSDSMETLSLLQIVRHRKFVAYPYKSY